MRILSLDQATVTGWAVVEETGALTASGIWKLADTRRTGESRGMRYIRFAHNLENALRTYRPDMICHEQTLLRGGAATEIANGLKALILKTAAEFSIEVSCVHTSELKHWATGMGTADKDAMMEACFSLSGHPPIDDNEADAILIGLWAASQYGRFQGPVWPDRKKPKKSRKKA